MFRVWLNASYVSFVLESSSDALETALDAALREKVESLRGFILIVLEENSVLQQGRTVANVSARSTLAKGQVKALGTFSFTVEGVRVGSVLYTEDEAIEAAQAAYLDALSGGEDAAIAAAKRAYAEADGMRNFTAAWPSFGRFSSCF